MDTPSVTVAYLEAVETATHPYAGTQKARYLSGERRPGRGCPQGTVADESKQMGRVRVAGTLFRVIRLCDSVGLFRPISRTADYVIRMISGVGGGCREAPPYPD